MKRSASLLLAALMIASMATLAACGDDGSEDTGSGSTGTTSGNVTTGTSGSNTPTGSSTTTTSSDSQGTTPTTTGGDETQTDSSDTHTPAPVEDIVLVAPDAAFHYRVFECAYSATGADGVYTTDDLADYMSRFGWELGDDTIPADALADIFTWDEANGPFGTESNVGYDMEGNLLFNNPDVDWTGDNHGLIVATTFTIENLEQFIKDYSEVYMTFWYDNTPSVYLNGRLVMYKNTNLSGTPDWVDSFGPIDYDDPVFDPLEGDTLMDRLVEGENTIVIVMKDAWGGRECCFELDAAP